MKFRLVGVALVIYCFRLSAASLWLNTSSECDTVRPDPTSEVCGIIYPEPNPKAQKESIVVVGKARFIVLTKELIRMEWAEDAEFEDRASMAFVNRCLPVPAFNVTWEGDEWVVISTESLKLRYRAGPDGATSPMFGQENLEVIVRFKDLLLGSTKDVSWYFGLQNKGNLGSTIRTLDLVEGYIPMDCQYIQRSDLHCTQGILSRDGWVFVDDSNRALFDGDPEWNWGVPRKEGNRLDWYLFAHGHDFKQGLLDFALTSGRAPIPPRYAFGVWWSRWWAFTDLEFQDLVKEYESFNLPLDVLVVDMDWHLTFHKDTARGVKDQAGEQLGWTGYTWDKNLFPNPQAFLAWCHRRGLKISMNLHPAAGVQPHEENYPQMAEAMGINPKTRRYVPFKIGDKKYAVNHWKHVLRPLEEGGVDFWWLDYQQNESDVIRGVGPTLWLNYAYFTNPYRWGNNERPINFHRFGGLGSHRYPIGFSGDTIANWQALEFQPYFTAAAANLGFGYWSHDIGGHFSPFAPEIYTRWIQLGAFSPIFRTHCNKDPSNERRFWTYPYKFFAAMRAAMQLRARLLPYIYTAARINYDTGISMARGLYIDYPDSEEAYVPDYVWEYMSFRYPGTGRLMRGLFITNDYGESQGLPTGRAHRSQFMFGPSMMVAPVVRPMVNATQLSNLTIWIPPGNWVEWCTGQVFTGSKLVTRFFTIDEIPVYVKWGSIIPTTTAFSKIGSALGLAEKVPKALILSVFTGPPEGESKIYDDHGNSNGYTRGEYSWTTVSYRQRSANSLMLTISPMVGDFDDKPNTREYTVRFLYSWPAESVVVNGESIPFSPQQDEDESPCWWYDGSELTVVVSLGPVPTDQHVDIRVKLRHPLNPRLLQQGIPGAMRRLKAIKGLLDGQDIHRVFQEDYQNVIHGAELASRLTYYPVETLSEVPIFQKVLRAALNDVTDLPADRWAKRISKEHIATLLGGPDEEGIDVL